MPIATGTGKSQGNNTSSAITTNQFSVNNNDVVVVIIASFGNTGTFSANILTDTQGNSYNIIYQSPSNVFVAFTVATSSSSVFSVSVVSGTIAGTLSVIAGAWSGFTTNGYTFTESSSSGSGSTVTINSTPVNSLIIFLGMFLSTSVTLTSLTLSPIVANTLISEPWNDSIGGWTSSGNGMNYNSGINSGGTITGTIGQSGQAGGRLVLINFPMTPSTTYISLLQLPAKVFNSGH